MKINAVIENKDGGTLVLDFPRSIYDVYEKIQSVGIRKSPHQITLSDEEGNDVRVKLYSEDEVGKHLLLTLNEQNTLADANLLAFMVDNAKEDFRSKLEQKLLHNQYGSMQEVTDDIKKMLYESGPVKAVFYCPLVGEVTDDEGFSSPVDGRFLKSYVEPHRAPYIADVAHTLEAEQKAVGDGLIEPIDNDDGTCLVGNEEPKLRGMDGNRRIGDGSSIMAGPFFVCGDSGESFRSLTDEEVTKYILRTLTGRQRNFFFGLQNKRQKQRELRKN